MCISEVDTETPFGTGRAGAAHQQGPPSPPSKQQQQQQQQQQQVPATLQQPPAAPPKQAVTPSPQEDTFVLPGSSAFAAVGTMIRKDESSDEEDALPPAQAGPKHTAGAMPGQQNGHVNLPIPPARQTSAVRQVSAGEPADDTAPAAGKQGKTNADKKPKQGPAKQKSGSLPAAESLAQDASQKLQGKPRQEMAGLAAPNAAAPTQLSPTAAAATPVSAAASLRPPAKTAGPTRPASGQDAQGSGSKVGAQGGVGYLPAAPAPSAAAQPAGPAPAAGQSAGADADSKRTAPPGFKQVSYLVNLHACLV